MNLKYKSLTFKINTTILESHMQKTLDTITGENKSAAIKAEHAVDISCKLNSNFALISLNFCEPFTGQIWISCLS